MFSPFKTFLFLLSCLLLLGITSFLLEKNEGKIFKDYKIKFYSINNLLNYQNNQALEDSVEKIIKETEIVEKEVDSIKSEEKTIIADTLKIFQVLKSIPYDKNFISKIEYPNGDKNILHYLLKSLKNATHQSTHILYYGDSQIEEDRFSGYIREKLQLSFGGSGCGLLSIMPIAQWLAPRIQYSENWYKWDCFADAGSNEETYGIMAQSFLIDFSKGNGKWTVRCKNATTTNVCLFNKVVMYYGNATDTTQVKFFNNGELISEAILKSDDYFNKQIFAVRNNEEISFEISGKTSPYFYGISLESFNNGVYVDNIALRGSSGTFFHLISRDLLKRFFNDLNVSMIILQFGGNIMPLIDSEEKVKKYANYIDYQIKIIKSIVPQVPILFVGPSDMSVNIDGVMQTHPYLESVINELRKVVLSNNCAFFDMYKAMGGKNSMPIWVEQNLAAKDYIHFSPAGARKMASIIYYSLIKDLQEINL